jgi:endo-1,4-beta-D-glucanase Y
MKKILLLINSLCIAIAYFAQAPQRPFPFHTLYIAGSIKPTNYTQAQLDDSTTFFYDQWKSMYLKNGCTASHNYIWFGDNPDNVICVSEGQGYGMLITAYMAGYDASAKSYFDGLYNYYKAHPSVNNASLMAWSQVTGCIDDPSGGDDGATDGDLDIAYALLLADKQWGSSGAINYLTEAISIINAIKQDDINPSIWTTKLGDWASPSDSMYYDTRPSDFTLNHFSAFQSATNDNAWDSVRNKCYSLIDQMQTNFSSSTGLLPDFIQYCNTSPIPAVANYLETEYDGDYSYNACRTPWRISLDYLLSGENLAKVAVDKINAWIRTKTNNDPTQIKSGYLLNGNDIPDNDYSSAAFIAPLTVSAMVSSTNQAWLNAAYSHLLAQQLPSGGYYENTLKMLALIAISGNWWAPASTTTGISNATENNEVSLYPNPFEKEAVLKIKALQKNDYGFLLCIYNSLGIKVSESFLPKGSEFKIERNNLSEGIYFYQLSNGGKIMNNGKFIISK